MSLGQIILLASIPFLFVLFLVVMSWTSKLTELKEVKTSAENWMSLAETRGEDLSFLQYLYETNDAEIIVLDDPMTMFSSSLVQRILPETHWKAGERYMKGILSSSPVPSPLTRRGPTLVVDTEIIGRDLHWYELMQKARVENGKRPAQFMAERAIGS